MKTYIDKDTGEVVRGVVYDGYTTLHNGIVLFVRTEENSTTSVRVSSVEPDDEKFLFTR